LTNRESQSLDIYAWYLFFLLVPVLV
jgi:hypothetical protein